MATPTLEFIPDNSQEDTVGMTPSELNRNTRSHQIFPVLSPADIKRMQRFGHVRHFEDGQQLFKAGVTTFGLMLVLRGRIAVSRYDGLGNTSPITEHSPGQFSGEVAQLSGRPSLGNGIAIGAVEVLVLPSESLRIGR